MKVAVYLYPASRRSELIAQAMFEGIRAVGDHPELRHGITYKGPDADVAVFYGLLRNVLDGYREAGKKAVYVDLGYWGRHEGGRRAGYHKVAVNSRHPTVYLQKIKHDGRRFDPFGVPILPQKRNGLGYVMIAGMSAKAAHAENLGPEEWERKAAVEVRRYTKREIVYRPKPNWHDARGIPGARTLRGDDGDVHLFLKDCHAVVTHHSNVAIDAALAGVPHYSVDGAGKLLSMRSLAEIEEPYLPDEEERRQFACDLAYAQWNVAEMRSGACWKHLRNEGLV